MPRKPEPPRKEETPRTDLPPRREPYYEGYFGTEEEEGVVREVEEGEVGEALRRGSPDADDETPRRGDDADDAGGDRGIE